MNSDQNPEDSNLEDITKLEETNDYITTAYGSLHYSKCKKCGRDDIIDTNGYNFCPYCGRKIAYQQRIQKHIISIRVRKQRRD